MTQHSRLFEQLEHFIAHKMRMSHVYQPVMLREILRHNGAATVNEVARALLAEDRSQVEYYEQITKNMVGRVLTKNRGITEKDNETYRVKGFSELSKREVDELIARCDAKIAEYLDKRNDPWSHRRKSTGYIPGTERYEVLKRARFRCELCGISAEHKAIEVDHIIPRNKGERTIHRTCRRSAIHAIRPSVIETTRTFAISQQATRSVMRIVCFARSMRSARQPKMS
jgi:ATP adenylyltransferase